MLETEINLILLNDKKRHGVLIVNILIRNNPFN